MELTKDFKKEQWGDGPWVEEPDLVDFEHQGIRCRVRRVANLEGYEQYINLFGGHLCGYVKIPKDHPLFNTNPTDFMDDEDFDVHGGITFNECNDGKHWIGFDCAHSEDVVPSMEKSNKEFEGDFLKKVFANYVNCIFKPTYKDIDFVTSETKSLAEQVKNWKGVEN